MRPREDIDSPRLDLTCDRIVEVLREAGRPLRLRAIRAALPDENGSTISNLLWRGSTERAGYHRHRLFTRPARGFYSLRTGALSPAERATVLSRMGEPADWIAIDLGVSVDAVHEAASEWAA